MAVRIPIKTEGGQQAADELKKVGDAGQSALDRINRASKEPATGLKALNGVTSELKGGLNDLSGSAGVVGRVLSSLGPMGLAASAAIGAFSAGLSVAIREADEAQRAGLKVDAMLRATASASGMTRKSIEDLAGAISETTLATQDDLMAAATQLLAFKNVSGETFGEVLRLSQDLAAAGFGTLSSAAVALGKSLENPGEALKALKQVGIEFGPEQLKMLDAMVQTGRAAEAQDVILEALRDKIGGTGSAEADGTLAGAFHILGERVEAFMEKIGDTGPLQTFTDFVRTMAEGMGVIDRAVFKDLDTQANEKFQELAEKKQQLDKLLNSTNSAGQTPDLMIERTRERITVLEAELKALTDKALAEAKAERAALDAAKTAKIVSSEEAMMAASRENLTKQWDAAMDKRESALKKEAAEQQRIKKVRIDAAASIDGQIESLENEQTALALSEKERAIFVELLKAEEVARKAGITVTNEQREAIIRETGALFDQRKAIDDKKKADEDATREAEKAAREREKIAEQEAEAMRRPFEHAAEGIQDSFTDAFEQIFSGNVDSFSDLADQIKNVFVRLAAEIATLLVFRPIVGSVLGSIGMTAAGNAVAGQSGGGVSLGGLPVGSLSSIFTNNGRGFGSILGDTSWQNIGANFAAGFAGNQFGSMLADKWGGGKSGGNVGGAIGGAVGSIWGPVGSFAGATLGNFVGSFIGAGPSNQSAFGRVDLSTGQRLATAPERNSTEETRAARDAIVNAVVALRAGLVEATGARFSGRVGLDVGMRDGIQVSGLGAGRYGSPEQAVAAIFEDMVDHARGLGREWRNVINGLDLKDLQGSVQALSDAAFIINKDYIAAEPLSAAVEAIKSIRENFAPIIQKARELGLAVAPIRAEQGRQIRLLRTDFNEDIERAILGITDPLAAALADFQKVAEERLENARDLGADLVDVERLNALERARIVEQYGQQANDSLGELIRSLGRTGFTPAATVNALAADFSDLFEAANRPGANLADLASQANQLAPQLITAGQQAYASGPQFQQLLAGVMQLLTQLQSRLNGGSATIQIVTVDGRVITENTLEEILARSARGEVVINARGVG